MLPSNGQAMETVFPIWSVNFLINVIWTYAAKNINWNIGFEVLTLKETTSLFARLLVIARSSRKLIVNLEEVIGMLESAYTNVLMAPDGSFYTTTDKSTVI